MSGHPYGTRGSVSSIQAGMRGGRKLPFAGGTPKKNNSWRVGVITSPRTPGNNLGSQAPHAKTNVPAESRVPEEVEISPLNTVGRIDSSRKSTPIRRAA